MSIDLTVRLLVGVLWVVAMVVAATMWRRAGSPESRERAGEAFALQHATVVSQRMAADVDTWGRRSRRSTAVALALAPGALLVWPPSWLAAPGHVFMVLAAIWTVRQVLDTCELASVRGRDPSGTGSRRPRVPRLHDHVSDPARAAIVVLAALSVTAWTLVPPLPRGMPPQAGVVLAALVLAAHLLLELVARRAVAAEPVLDDAGDQYVADALITDRVRHCYALGRLPLWASTMTLIWLGALDRAPLGPWLWLLLTVLTAGFLALEAGELRSTRTQRFQRRLWPDGAPGTPRARPPGLFVPTG